MSTEIATRAEEPRTGNAQPKPRRIAMSHHTCTTPRTLVTITLALVSLVLATVTNTAAAATLTWNVNDYTGTWDRSAANWVDINGDPAVFSDGDDVVFPNFYDLGVRNNGYDHSWYVDRTITIADGGGTPISPGSISFSTTHANYLHFAGADLGGTAGGITIDGNSVPARLVFDHTTSLSFTGNVNIENGASLYHNPNAAGTYSLGTGKLVFDNAASLRFNYSPTVSGATLANAVEVQSGTLALSCDNSSTFSGDLNLYGGDINLNSPPGDGDIALTWSGNVNLNTDSKIIGGAYNNGGNPVLFSGQFTGSDHTLTLDFNGAENTGSQRAIQATSDTQAWNIGDLVLTNGRLSSAAGGSNTPNLLVHTTNADDDHFALLRVNGGKVSIEDNAQLFVRRGGINFSDLQSDATGRVFFDGGGSSYDVTLLGAGMDLRSTAGYVQTAAVGFNNGATGSISGDISVGDGGQFELRGLYGKGIQHADGDLRLTNGSTLYARWSRADWDWIGLAYAMQDSSQKVYLGDGDDSLTETITFRGAYNKNTADVKGAFFFGTDSANVVDDGNVVLRYESELNGNDFNMGWADFANTNGYAIYGNNEHLAFRGGSAGTEFAPASNADSFGAVGPRTGTVFTATAPTSLVTEGTVGFYNNNSPSSGGSRGAPGAVVVDSGGTFDLVANGIVIASSLTVQNTGGLSGIGTFQADVTVNDGTVSPGNSIGTLTIDGDASFNNGSTIVIEIAGTDADQFDVLNVTGTMSVDAGSTLQLVWADDYTLSPTGGSFDIFDFTALDQISGAQFALDTALAPIASYMHWDTSQLYTSGIITAIPEPASALLLGLAGLALIRRRQK